MMDAIALLLWFPLLLAIYFFARGMVALVAGREVCGRTHLVGKDARIVGALFIAPMPCLVAVGKIMGALRVGPSYIEDLPLALVVLTMVLICWGLAVWHAAGCGRAEERCSNPVRAR